MAKTKKPKTVTSPLELVLKTFHRDDGSVIPFRHVLRDYVSEEGIFKEGEGSWRKLYETIDKESKEKGKDFNRALLDKLRSDPKRYRKMRDIFLRNREIEATTQDAKELEEDVKSGRYGDFWKIAKAFDFDQRRISDALYILYPETVLDSEAAYHIVTRLISGRVKIFNRDVPEDPLEDLKEILRKLEPDRLLRDRTLAKLCLDAAEERVLPQFAENSGKALAKLEKDLESSNEGSVHYVLEYLLNTYKQIDSFKITGSVNSILDPDTGSALEFPSMYQKVGIKKILDQKRVLIADEMGLGKTAQSILAFIELRNREPEAGHKALVICPAGVIEHWKKELGNYLEPELFESLKTVAIQSHNKKSALEQAATSDVVFVSYDMIIRNGASDDDSAKIAEILSSIGFTYTIIDEVHKAKNPRYNTRFALAISSYLESEKKKKKMAITCSAENIEDWADGLSAYASGIGKQIKISTEPDADIMLGEDKPADEERRVFSEDDFDEYAACQRSALVHELVSRDGSEYLVLLSGTPLPNRISDIGNIASMLEPENYPDARSFNEQSVYDPSLIRQLLIRKMIRRRVSDVMTLPPLEIEKRELRMDAAQEEAYRLVQENLFDLSIAEKMVWQRLATINPRKLNELASERMDGANDEQKKALRELWSVARRAGSVKFAEMKRIAEIETTADRKLVVFSSVLREGVIQEAVSNLEQSSISTVYIDGTVETGKDGGERERIRQKFSSYKGPSALVAMLKTMNEGISLTRANTVVFLDYPYNDAEAMQGIARLWRRNQKNPVKAIFLSASGTLDESAEMLIKEKNRITKLLIDGIPPTDEERALFDNRLTLKYGPFADALKTPRQVLGEHISRMVNRSSKNNLEYLMADGGKNAKSIADLYLFRWEKSFSGNTARAVSILIDSIEESEGKKIEKIIDIGSGPAILTRASGRPTTCVDINPFVLAKAKADFPEIETVEGSMDNLPLKDSSFDLSLFSLSLHQSLALPTEPKKDGDREKSVKEALRVLKLGGWFVVSEPIKQVNEEGVAKFASALGQMGMENIKYGYVKDAEGGSFKAFVLVAKKSDRMPNAVQSDSFVLNTEPDIRYMRSRRIFSTFPVEEGKKVELFEFSGMDGMLDTPKSHRAEKSRDGFVISASEYLKRHNRTVDRRLDELEELERLGGKEEAHGLLDKLVDYDSGVRATIDEVDPDMLEKGREFVLKRKKNGGS